MRDARETARKIRHVVQSTQGTAGFKWFDIEEAIYYAIREVEQEAEKLATDRLNWKSLANREARKVQLAVEVLTEIAAKGKASPGDTKDDMAREGIEKIRRTE